MIQRTFRFNDKKEKKTKTILVVDLEFVQVDTTKLKNITVDTLFGLFTEMQRSR